MFDQQPAAPGRDSRAQKDETPTTASTMAGADKPETTPAILQARHALVWAVARVAPVLANSASLGPVCTVLGGLV
jgi:hypothetical protein